MRLRHIKALTLFNLNSSCIKCGSSDVEQHQMNILDPKILAAACSACGRSRGWITQAHFNAYDGPKVIERPQRSNNDGYCKFASSIAQRRGDSPPLR